MRIDAYVLSVILAFFFLFSYGRRERLHRGQILEGSPPHGLLQPRTESAQLYFLDDDTRANDHQVNEDMCFGFCTKSHGESAFVEYL